MNKYSSKAIKTAATVGMSLAMVFSNVAPVLAVDTPNDDIAVCSATATKESMVALNQFRSDNADWAKATADTTFNAKKVTEGGKRFDADGTILSDTAKQTSASGTKYPQTITVGNTQLKLVWDVDGTPVEATSEQTGDGTKAYYYATSKDSAAFVVKKTETVKIKLIDYMAGALSNDIEDNIVTTITGATVDKIVIRTGTSASFNAALQNLSDNCYDTGDNAYKVNADKMLDLIDAVTTTGDALVTLAIDGKTEIFDKIAKVEAFLEKYDTNLSYAQKVTLNNALENYYSDESIDSSTNTYQVALTNFLDKITTDLEKTLTDSKYTSLGSVNDSITTATIDKWVKDFKDSTGYKRFKNEDSVIEFLSSIQEMKDDAKAILDIVNKAKNDAYKAYAKGGSDSALSKVAGISYSKANGIATGNFTIEQYNLLKDFKEEVVDKVANLDVKLIGNRYVNKTTKSVYASKAQQYDKVMNDFGNLEDLVDTEDGKFMWDYLTEHMEKVISSLKTLEKDLPSLDAVTLQASDRDILIAADDAVYFLSDKGNNNLTNEQKRTVRDASRKVTELFEAYRKQFGSINTEINGWVNKGNGDWAYYENGNAVTKWVASGSDWYYVKGGVMLRNSWIASDSQGTKWYYVDDAGKMVSNTTVNGYSFNSYGVWVK